MTSAACRQRNPWHALLVLFVMASLAGVPPFLGLLGQAGGAARGGGWAASLWLAIVGVVCAVIGAFYYLRVIKVMYFDEPDGRAAAQLHGDRRAARRVRASMPRRCWCWACSAEPIMAWCRQAFPLT